MTSENINPKVSFLEGLDERINSLEPDSPLLTSRFGKEILEDYLKLKALLRFEKNQTSPQPLQPFLSQSDQLLLELDNEIELGAEEEDESPENFAFLKDLSNFNSKKSSIFSLNAPSKKNSLFAPPASRRHPSFLSDYQKRRTSNHLLPNLQPKRSSAMFPLMTQVNEDAKKRSSALLPAVNRENEETRKRNSSILKDISLKLLQKPKIITSKGIFDNIKKSSKFCSLSLSSLKSSDQNSNPDYDSGNQDPMDQDNVLSESSSESESNISQEDLLENAQEQIFTKVSLVKYGNKRFLHGKATEKKRLADLKKMNLLDDFYHQERNANATECEFKKFNVSDKKFLPYQPYYFLEDQNIVKHTYKRSKKTLYITREPNKSNDKAGSSSIEFGTLKLLDSATNTKNNNANFYITKNVQNEDCDLELEKTQDAYTVLLKCQNLYSQKLDLANLKNYSSHPHLQMKSLNEIGLISDCGSKRGTFVQLNTNSPKALQEGDLFLLNSKFGFYVKPLEEDAPAQENTLLEILCVNKVGYNSSMSLSNSPTISPIGSAVSKGKIAASSPSSELKDLYLKRKSPNVKLELVRWNEALEEYEENGTIVILYNEINQIGAFESSPDNSVSIAYNSKNWVNLFEGSKIMSEVAKRLEFDRKVFLSYNFDLRAWSIEVVTHFDETSLTGSPQLPENFELNPSIPHNEKVLKGINIPPVDHTNTNPNPNPNPKKDEENLLTGIWLSTSKFDILQDKFDSTWMPVGLPSCVMFDDIIFRMNPEKTLTLSI